MIILDHFKKLKRNALNLLDQIVKCINVRLNIIKRRLIKNEHNHFNL